MKVFVTGATGFIGRYTLRKLSEAGHEIRALTRPGSEDKLADMPDVETVSGDINDPESLDGAMDGCEAVVHLVGIIQERPEAGVTFERIHLEGAKNIIDEAKKAGVSRFVLMSANGVKSRKTAVSAYQWTKYEAEEYLKESGLEYVVFRPSVVFGRPETGQPEFASQLTRDLLGMPLAPLPLFKAGLPTLAELVKSMFPFAKKWQSSLAAEGSTFELQPVSVENLSDAIAQSVDLPAARNQTYEAGGRDRLRWGEMLDILTEASGRKKPRWKAVVPAFMIHILLSLPGIRNLLPLSHDQLDMLLEGNVCLETAFFRDFDIQPIPFNAETAAYASEVEAVKPEKEAEFLLRHYDHPVPNTGVSHAKFGMWVFLATEVMFFTGLIGAYVVLRNATPDWPDPSDRLSLGLTAVMTFILIMSSVSLVMGLSGLQQGRMGKFKLYFALTVLFGATFVGLQAYEWNHFLAKHLPSEDMFWSVFYTLTGFHGAHVTIGVIALIWVFVQGLRGVYTPTSHNTVEMTGLYWHFVDLVWIILFTIIYLI
ncbi:MAG: NAD(P)H-binding protein [Candidatus Poribacteria bacterium]|nr:NAD(P)H-binding protein [Candidatus Poribacteria bacterium]